MVEKKVNQSEKKEGKYLQEMPVFTIREIENHRIKTSVIWQKGDSQTACVCVSGGKKCLFFGNFGVLCFLETPVLRFALLPYYRRKVQKVAEPS